MKQLLLICAAVALVGGCASTPNSLEGKAAIEKAIRNEIEKPTGQLTKADYEKVVYPTKNVVLWWRYPCCPIHI